MSIRKDTTTPAITAVILTSQSRMAAATLEMSGICPFTTDIDPRAARIIKGARGGNSILATLSMGAEVVAMSTLALRWL